MNINDYTFTEAIRPTNDYTQAVRDAGLDIASDTIKDVTVITANDVDYASEADELTAALNRQYKSNKSSTSSAKPLLIGGGLLLALKLLKFI